jgi:hypothetical protein
MSEFWSISEIWFGCEGQGFAGSRSPSVFSSIPSHGCRQVGAHCRWGAITWPARRHRPASGQFDDILPAGRIQRHFWGVPTPGFSTHGGVSSPHSSSDWHPEVAKPLPEDTEQREDAQPLPHHLTRGTSNAPEISQGQTRRAPSPAQQPSEQVRFDTAAPRTRIFWTVRPSPTNSPVDSLVPAKREAVLSWSGPHLHEPHPAQAPVARARSRPPSPQDELFSPAGDLAVRPSAPCADATRVMHPLAADPFPPRSGQTLPTPKALYATTARGAAAGREAGREWQPLVQLLQQLDFQVLVPLPSFLSPSPLVLNDESNLPPPSPCEIARWISPYGSLWSDSTIFQRPRIPVRRSRSDMRCLAARSVPHCPLLPSRPGWLPTASSRRPPGMRLRQPEWGRGRRKRRVRPAPASRARRLWASSSRGGRRTRRGRRTRAARGGGAWWHALCGVGARWQGGGR